MERLKRPFFGPIFQYLQEFTPKEWGEKRPFAYELDYTAYYLVLKPRDEKIREKLGKIEGVHTRQDHTCIAVQRNAQSIARNFYWFALRSLRDNEYRNLWALFHGILNSNDGSTSTEEVAGLTGYDLPVNKKWLDELVDTGILVKKGKKFVIKDINEGLCILSKKYTNAAPTSTEEVVMGLLCSDYGLWKGEVCERMLQYHRLGRSAVYKAINKLISKDFLSVVSKHVGRGPARDYLFVNCRNCFFMFASKEECLEYETEKLYVHLEKGFGKELTDKEKKVLINFIRDHRDAPPLLRKLNLTLDYFLQLKKELTQDTSLQEAMYFLDKKLKLKFDILKKTRAK